MDTRDLAESLRNVEQWHGLGIDAQAKAILNLPEIQNLILGGISMTPVSYETAEPEEKDCNEKGECWRFNPGNKGFSNPFLVHDSWVLSRRKIGTHWLPHNSPYLPANFKG